MAYTKEKLSVAEKFGYSLGDFAANLIFQTILIFQMAFYTDTFGITAAAAGTLFLAVRFSDAITDPLMGIIADRTKTRWGKFRPWIIIGAIPLAVLTVLTFSTPDFDYTGKLIYAYLTYGLLMMAYTMNNLPYSALSGVMTGDPVERTSLSSYRFAAMTAAAMIVQGLALPMVNYFGQGNDEFGYTVTMSIFAVIGLVCFVVVFMSTKERIEPSKNQQTSIKRDLRDLTENGPWVVMFLVTIFIFVTLSMRGAVIVYYFRYYVGSEPLLSYFLVSGLIATIPGILLAKPMSARFGKRDVFMWALIATAIFNASFYIYPPEAVEFMFAAEILRQFAYGFTIPLLWAMMGDVADYSEWKNNRRATGVVFSAVVFGLKAGQGIGGALTGWLLDLYGYQANVAQTTFALDGIVLTASIYCAITFLIAAGIMYFYRIDINMENEMTDELDRRRYAEAKAEDDAAASGSNA